MLTVLYLTLTWLIQLLVYDVHLGATFDPNQLPNHQGSYFQHPNVKLIQVNICDLDKISYCPGRLTPSFNLEHWFD